MTVSLIVFTAFLTCTLTSSFYFRKNKRQDAQQYLDTVTDSICNTLKNLEKDLDQITTMPYYFGMANILKKYVDSQDEYVLADDVSEISNQLAYIQDMKSSIVNAYVAMENGKLLGVHYQNGTEKWNWANMPWLSSCKTNGALTMIPWHDASYARNAPTSAISFVRIIKDIWTMNNIGWLVIDLDAEEFHMCVPDKSVYGESFYIFNANGQMVYPYPDKEEYVADKGFLSKLNVEESCIQSKMTIPQMELTVIGILDISLYDNGTFALHKTLFLVSIIMLALSVLLVNIITRSIYRPIRQLHQAMGEIIENHFAIPDIHVDSNDEIADLANGFNQMIQEIQRLLKRIEEKNIKERKILFALLQGQMSPHFIYNTLEMLGSMAMISQNYTLADGISALGRLMRHLTDNGDQETYLEDELRFVEDYIYLQTLTTGLEIDFCHDIDFSHGYLLVPKFILQPLVENVYKYAGKGQKIELIITSQIKNEKLILTMSNNGKGISPERLEQIRKRIYAPDIAEEKAHNRNHGFALRNIHQRIQLLYGEEYGLFVTCKHSSGFEIVIELPVIWEEEEHEDRDRRG